MKRKIIYLTIFAFSLCLLFYINVLGSTVTKIKAESTLPPPITDDAGLLKADLLKHKEWIPLKDDKLLPNKPTLTPGLSHEGSTEFHLYKENNLTSIFIQPSDDSKATVKQVVDTVPGKIYQFSAGAYTRIRYQTSGESLKSKYDMFVFPGTTRPTLDSLYYYKVEEDRAFSVDSNIEIYGREVFVANSNKTTVEYNIYSNNSRNTNRGFIYR